MCSTEITGIALSRMSRSVPALEIGVGVLGVLSLIMIMMALLICTSLTTLTSTLKPTPTARKKVWRHTVHPKVLRARQTPYIAITVMERSPMSPRLPASIMKVEKGWESCSGIMTTMAMRIVMLATMLGRIFSIRTGGMAHLQTSVGWRRWKPMKTGTSREQWASILGIMTMMGC